MSEWKEYKLGELGKIVTGKTPPTSQHQNYDGDIPFICIPDLGKSRFIFHTNKTISKIGLETVKNCSLPKGSVVVSCIATIGQVGITTKDISVTNQQINSLIPDSNLITEEFCYYYFKNLGEDLAQFGGGGSIFEIISKDKFSKVYLTIPSLPEQTAIASVLSSLDDKIDLLHRQNATLEKMAETLFRQWFIEEAKEREKTKIGLVLETVLGGTPSTKKPEYWDGTIPWINSGEVNNFRILKPTKFITELGLAESNTKLLPIGTTVLAITGATLGQISLLEISTCANQSVVGIIPNETYPKEYVFLWIKYMIDEIILNETGGAQPHINKNDVNETEILVPCNDDLEFIESKIKPLFKKISINSFQINTLIELRDSLLPKLMSGEITVNQG